MAYCTKNLSDVRIRKSSVVVGQKGFEPATEHLEASSLEYDWASKFLGCLTKDLFMVSSSVPNVRAGTYFFGEQKIIKEIGFTAVDHRNLNYAKTEEPLRRKTVQLNSKESFTFIQEGMLFYRNGSDSLIVKHSPGWGSTHVTVYSKDEFGETLLSRCWDWARKNNFLKGEAFALTGDFLSREGVKTKDIFLEPQNKAIVNGIISKINKHGSTMKSRGIVLLGPAGTGKTLSCKAIKNETECSYIWVSARDFYNCGGGVSGICTAFDIAKEIAPTCIAFEDVDHWIRGNATDLLKTEMDGVNELKGIVTILTTNYPESLPPELIDRPGRFHDLACMDLPSDKVRKEMFAEWADSLSDSSSSEITKATSGFSGAHIKELCDFAETIKEEDGSITLHDAIMSAIEKIKKQRNLIGSNQNVRRYRRGVKSFASKTKEMLLSQGRIS